MYSGQGDYRPHENRPSGMSHPVLDRTTVAHARLPAHVHRRQHLQVVGACETRSAANDLVSVDVEVRDPSGSSGRVGVGGVAVAVGVARHAEGVEVVVEPFADAGRGIAERTVEALFANRMCQDLMMERDGWEKGWSVLLGLRARQDLELEMLSSRLPL